MTPITTIPACRGFAARTADSPVRSAPHAADVPGVFVPGRPPADGDADSWVDPGIEYALWGPVPIARRARSARTRDAGRTNGSRADASSAASAKRRVGS